MYPLSNVWRLFNTLVQTPQYCTLCTYNQRHALPRPSVFRFQVPDRATMIRELEERKRHNTRTSVAFGSAKVCIYAPQNEMRKRQQNYQVIDKKGSTKESQTNNPSRRTTAWICIQGIEHARPMYHQISPAKAKHTCISNPVEVTDLAPTYIMHALRFK